MLGIHISQPALHITFCQGAVTLECALESRPYLDSPFSLVDL